VFSYKWNNGGNLPSTQVNPTITTEYSVIVQDDKGCFSDTLKVTAFVRDSLKISATSDQEICKGDTVNLTASGSGGDMNLFYKWNIYKLNSKSVVVTPNQTTTYYINLYDGCETPSVKDSVIVVVNEGPIVDFSSDLFEGCAPLTVSFSNEDLSSGLPYEWGFGDGGTQMGESSKTHTFNEPGVYDVSFNVESANGCVVDEVFKGYVEVYETPQGIFRMYSLYFEVNQQSGFHQWIHPNHQNSRKRK